MMLHCAGRIGLLSYLYEQRHHIALALGMIDEIPMTMCSYEYNPNDGLIIHEHHPSQEAIPPVLFSSQEIHLFLHHPGEIPTNPMLVGMMTKNQTNVIEGKYLQPARAIFHPPC